MSTAEERGALGERFHDLPTPASNPELEWENMARRILLPEPPEEEPRKRRAAFWWWFGGIAVLLAGAFLLWPAEEDHNPVSEEQPTVIAKGATTAEEKLIEATIPLKNPVKEQLPATTLTKGIGQEKALLQVVEVGKTVWTEEVSSTTEENLAPSLAPELAQPEVTIDFSRKAAVVVTQLPGGGIPMLDQLDQLPEVQARNLPFPVKPKGEASLAITLGGGAFQSGYAGDAPWLAAERNDFSPSLSLRYERPLTQNWFLSTGIDLRNYRFRTAFENVDPDARLYRPGTIDTIFRNLTTGEERTVFTDTVPGTVIRRFGNDNVVTEIGIPLLIAYRWASKKHALSLAIGPRLGLVVTREGRSLTGTNEVRELSEVPQFGNNLRWSGRLEAVYDYRITSSISLLAKVGGEAAFSNWSSSLDLKQRPKLVGGQLGLRFLLR
ncbi:MAG: hypothetical protein AAGF89_06015 [Bacteroidota bacterium]